MLNILEALLLNQRPPNLSEVANWNWKYQTMTNRLGFSHPFEVWFCRKAFLLGGCKGVSYLCGDNLLTPKDNRQNWQKNRWESLQNGLLTVKLTIRVCGKNPHGSIWPAPLVSTMEVQIFAKRKTIMSNMRRRCTFNKISGTWRFCNNIAFHFVHIFCKSMNSSTKRCIGREKSNFARAIQEKLSINLIRDGRFSGVNPIYLLSYGFWS